MEAGTMTEAMPSPITSLNEDCLLQILSYLTVTKRIQLEQVCQRWRSIIRRTFYCAKSVNVADFLFAAAPIYKTHYQQDHILLTPTATGLISHCAPYVRHLSFGHQWLKISQPVMDEMGAGCHRLTSLDLSGCIVDADILPALTELATRLRYLSLDDTAFVRPDSVKDLHLLFHRFLHLRSLGLANAACPLRRLVDLPEDLEHINLADVRDLPTPVLLDFLRHHHELRSLSLANYRFLEQTVVEELAKIPSLESLDLSGLLDEDAINLGPLAALRALQTLTLNQSRCVDTKALATLSRALGPRLRRLHLQGCKRLLDYSPLGGFRVLEELSVGGTYQLCDEDLQAIADRSRLSVVKIASCPNVSMTGIKALAENCPLQQIAIHKCQEITNEALIVLSSCPSTSLQNCQITTAGFQAMVRVAGDRVLCQTELDVSYNRGVTDDAVLALYLHFLQARKGAKASTPAPAPQKRQRQDSDCEAKEAGLTLYAHQTNITSSLVTLVKPFFNLVL